MLNLKGQPELPLYSHQCNVSQGKFLPHIHPDEALDVNGRCNKNPLGIISCKSNAANSCISEINGLGLSDIVANGNNALHNIPHFIPVIDGRFFKNQSNLLTEHFIGISLKDTLLRQPNFANGCVRIENMSINEELLGLF